MQFAYQFPERVERLVLVSSGGLGREVHLILRAATLPGSSSSCRCSRRRWLRTTGGAVGATARPPRAARRARTSPGSRAGIASLDDADARARVRPHRAGGRSTPAASA